MKGLFIKDIMTQKNRLITAVMVCIGVVAFAILIVLSMYYGNIHSMLKEEGFFETNTLRGMIMVLSFAIASVSGYLATMVTSAFNDDYKADFGKVSMTLPVSAAERVTARYLLYGVYLLLMVVLNLLLQPVFYMVAGVPFTGEAFIVIAAGFSLCVFLILLDMPLMYRFGAWIPSVMNVFLAIALCVLLAAGMNYMTETDIPVSEINTLFVTARNGLAILFPVLVVLGMPLSLLLSLRILKGGRYQLC